MIGWRQHCGALPFDARIASSGGLAFTGGDETRQDPEGPRLGQVIDWDGRPQACRGRGSQGVIAIPLAL